jgi:hypothetical protein
MQAPLHAKNDSDAAQTDTARTVAQKVVLADDSREAMGQPNMAEMRNNGPRVLQQQALSDAMHNSPRMVAQRHDMNAHFGEPVKQQGTGAAPVESSRVQREEKPNNTGLPNQLKSGIESLSGMSMDHVKVHYNSDKPAQLQAHAYAQGRDIHLAPGQEKHLPHEAWHVVQQTLGRVRPTMQMARTVPLNDDRSLEREADVMGGRAAALGTLQAYAKPEPMTLEPPGWQSAAVAQRRLESLIDASPHMARVRSSQALASASSQPGQMHEIQRNAIGGSRRAYIGLTGIENGISAPIAAGRASDFVIQRQTFFIGPTSYKSESFDREGILGKILLIEELPEDTPERQEVKANAKLSLSAALEDDIKKAARRGGDSYAIERRALKQRLETGPTQVASTAPVTMPRVPAFALSDDDVHISGAGDPTLFARGMGLTGFEKIGGQDKGDDHFKKHGHEVNAQTKQQYIKSAQDLGRATGNNFIEAKVKGSLIRYDPSNGQIVISSAKLIRTHYVWDKKYSDPVAYAIYYTITSNLNVPLNTVAPEVIRKLSSKKIDLRAMEIEYIRIGAAENKSVSQLASETHLVEADVIDILHAPPAGSAGKGDGLPNESASSARVQKETVTIHGKKYDVTDPRIRHDGNCLWDTLNLVYRYPADALQRAAARVEGVAYGTYVDDIKVWHLLEALDAPGMTLDVWQYGKEQSAKRTVFGDGSIVIGLAHDPTGQGHYIPPADI